MNVWVEVQKSEAPASKAELDKVTANAGKKVGFYLDISLFKQFSDEQTARPVSLTNQKIRLAIQIPEGLRKTNTGFAVVRYHEGITEELQTEYDEQTGMLYVWTDKFSDYAVIMQPKVVTPATGITESNTSTSIMLCVIALAVAGLIAVLIVRRKKY